jgi:hypothetical protein
VHLWINNMCGKVIFWTNSNCGSITFEGIKKQITYK